MKKFTFIIHLISGKTIEHYSDMDFDEFTQSINKDYHTKPLQLIWEKDEITQVDDSDFSGFLTINVHNIEYIEFKKNN